eukprot:8694853-Pyramimonas_sp.AAC.1
MTDQNVLQGLKGWLRQPKHSVRYSLAHLLSAANTILSLPNTIAATHLLRAPGFSSPRIITRALVYSNLRQEVQIVEH